MFDDYETIEDKVAMDVRTEQMAEQQRRIIKRSECPYKGIDCAWCDEECEG